MSTLVRRRRRRLAALRSPPVLVAGIVGVLVVLLLVGGALRVGTVSRSYWRAIDRSYAAQARVLVAESDRVGQELTALLVAMPADTRGRLQAALDTLVRAGDSMAVSASTMASPAPAAGVGTQVADAFSARARALTELRTTVDRLLGMAPLPVVGAPATTDPSGSAAVLDPSPSITTMSAGTALARIGGLLDGADRTYGAARRALRAAPGGALLPRSEWVRHPAQWSAGAAQAMATSLGAALQLAVVHRVALLTSDVALTPAAVPTLAAPAPGTSVVPPTDTLTLSVVVANEGDVPERGLVVRAHAVAVASSAAAGGDSARSDAVSLAAGTSSAVSLPALHVRPGQTYVVTLSVTTPAGEAAGATTTDSFVVVVAPGTSASSATTTTTTPRSGSTAARG